MGNKKCRFCGSELKYVFVDLGMSPLANSYVKYEDMSKKEEYYPLCVYVCEKCLLTQLEEFESPQKIFTDYAYFSSYSKSWLRHAENYVEMVTSRFKLDKNTKVLEIASNDGYLLQYFKKKSIPVLGIEPAINIAKVANDKGIKTISEFFGSELATNLVDEGYRADVVIGNNVLAHVPEINDFVEGIKLILSDDGIITMEFPHLLELIKNNQFDTIYHEHFSYLSLMAVEKIFMKHDLKIFDVDQLTTHGGSIRIYAKHKKNKNILISSNVKKILDMEVDNKMDKISTYTNFSEKVKETKQNILEYLINLKRNNFKIAAYGAPAKGNTLLNYCGIGKDFIDFTVDMNPYKQSTLLPGSRIPVYSPEKIKEEKPDFIIILPWNIKQEIINQMSFIRDWNGKFITLIPKIEVI